MCLTWSGPILCHITTAHALLLHQNYRYILMYLLLYFWGGHNKQRHHLGAITLHTILRRQDSLSAVGYVGFCNIVLIHHSATETKWSAFYRRHFKCVLVTENAYGFIQIFRNFFLLRAKLESHHWFRQWFGTEQASSYYTWTKYDSSLTHMCVNRP